MAMSERERREAAIRGFGALVQHSYKTPKPGSANLPCKECGLGVEAPEHKMSKKATDLEPIPVEDAAPHKFEPMPGNKKPTLCNKCLERKDHANHFTDSTKTVKMADSAHKARLHRALDAVMDSTGK